MEKKTYRLTLSYDGSPFKGWHTQKNVPTVQGTLNELISQLYEENVFVWGAGRTDSGAHALKYTAHYRVHNELIPQDEIKEILNSRLPSSIYVYEAQQVDNLFHSTFSCKARTYCYFVYLGDVLPEHHLNKVYQEYRTLDVSLIKPTISLFEGTHDFTHFCYGYTAKEKSIKNMVRRVDSFKMKQKGDYLMFVIKGEGFLRGMIRTLIGSTLSVAKKNLTIEDIKNALAGKELPNGSWKPVPASGLFFKRAHY